MRVLKEGTRLAERYRLLERLGSGRMSEVWLAEDGRADGRVALKFLDAALAGDDRRRELFHGEWRQASRLMHAHIVRTFEYHDDEDGPYFGLQYLPGPHLSELGSLPLETRLKPFGFLADALRYAHGKGVVHRDVKAENVLFDARGAPYLIDFGVADTAGGDAQRAAGTPVAQSPGQRAGRPAEPADDVYALGVLLHEVVTAAPPDEGRVADADADGRPLPRPVAGLLAEMLASEARDRPDAGTVGARLADAGFAPGVVPLPRRHGGTEPAAEALAVRSVRPARRAAAPAPGIESSGRGLSPAIVAGGLAVLLAAFLGVVFLLPDAVERAPAPQPSADETAAPAAAGEQGDAAAAAESAPAASGETEASRPPRRLPADSEAQFSENVGPEGIKAATDEALGDLLSRLERLRYRGVERWGGQDYLDAVDRYEAGDQAYLNKNYESAGEHYRAATGMLDPLFDRIDQVFAQTMKDARAAFEAEDFREAIRLYDLAATITPGNAEAQKGLERARSLEDVLRLTERARELEEQLELEAAKQALEKALELDPLWEPAKKALARVETALNEMRFERRMTEGFDALANDHYESARASFEAAKSLKPDSQQPVDGLLQVDQEVRLARIRDLEARAKAQVENEQWEAAVETYREALSVDPDLQFAQEGLRQATERAALHAQLQEYIENPDSLSQPQTMQEATDLLLRLSRVTPQGPRLDDQTEALSRLLKRAATPLPVTIVSDNKTEVSIYQVGRLGTFENRQVELRPGSYVAVGSRPGYRDVRREFRVAPEIDMEPIVVECEEAI